MEVEGKEVKLNIRMNTNAKMTRPLCKKKGGEELKKVCVLKVCGLFNAWSYAKNLGEPV